MFLFRSQSSRTGGRGRSSGTLVSRGRRGITLFEVVLALSIFVGAFAAISQILRTGSRSAIRAQLTSEAVLRSELTLNELLGGIQPLQSTSQTAYVDDPNWTWSLNVLDGGIIGLLQLELTVEHRGSRNESSVSYQVVRMIRDPQVFFDAAESDTGGETL